MRAATKCFLLLAKEATVESGLYTRVASNQAYTVTGYFGEFDQRLPIYNRQIKVSGGHSVIAEVATSETPRNGSFAKYSTRQKSCYIR